MYRVMMAGLVLAAALGCDSGRVREQQIEVKPQTTDPLDEARGLIQRYANGQPMTSEVTTFPELIGKVRAKDPAKADVLEAGLADLQKAPPAALPARAKELLKKLE